MKLTSLPITPRSLALAAVVALLVGGPAVWAQDSNRNEVRANLEKDGWSVVWGKNFTEADWARGAKAIAESVAAENPGPFLAWFEQVLNENLNKIQANMKNVTRQDLERWIVQSLKEKRPIAFKGLTIEAGFATYNRWNRVVTEVPDGFEFQGLKSKVKMKKIEKSVPLPNWNQFYIRYKLIPDNQGPAGNGGGKPLGQVAREVRIEYTIRNDTKETVQFRLPTGKSYSLKPGEKGNYKNTGRPENLKIYVFNSNKEYQLGSGSHKFWFMKKDNRVGFDMNYEK